jgi:hypothetical protein
MEGHRRPEGLEQYKYLGVGVNSSRNEIEVALREKKYQILKNYSDPKFYNYKDGLWRDTELGTAERAANYCLRNCGESEHKVPLPALELKRIQFANWRERHPGLENYINDKKKQLQKVSVKSIVSHTAWTLFGAGVLGVMAFEDTQNAYLVHSCRMMVLTGGVVGLCSLAATYVLKEEKQVEQKKEYQED